MSYTRNSIIVNGQKVIYHQFGQGKPLLFLHGGRVRALTFEKLLNLLAQNYTVIAPDIPGFGESMTPDGIWSYIDYANFFEEFLNTLNVEKITVLGYSMGGGIAFNLATVSKRISRLLLVNASGLGNKSGKHQYKDLRRIVFYTTHPQYFSSFLLLLRDYIQYLWKHRTDWQHMSQIRSKCFSTLYTSSFKQISVPVVIFWGQDDWIYPMSVAREFKKRIPSAVLKIVKGNHDWLLYNPAQFNKVINIQGKT